MSKFRVVKVLLYGEEKYAPQYHTTETIWKKPLWLHINNPSTTKEVWKTFHTIVEGTDEWTPCYYDTKDEAWGRIKKHESNLILNKRGYTITAEYYE